jgi:hypothetical protein
VTRQAAHGGTSHVEEWRGALGWILTAFLISRGLLVVIVALVEGSLPLAYERPTFSEAPILGGLTGHDAIYLLGIARDGYHLTPVQGQFYDWVFFPLYPLLVRLTSLATGLDIAVAGVFVANAAGLTALVLVYKLARRHLDSGSAGRAVFLVALAPGAVAMGMAYSDSLLLACAAGAMLAAERRRYPAMGVLFALAVLSRPPGILMVVPLLAVILQNEGRKPSLSWLPLALGPAAIAAFAGYQGVVLGDPIAFVNAQRAWDIPTVVSQIPTGPYSGGSTLALVVLLLGTLLFYTALLPMLRRAPIPLPHVLVAVAAFASVFLSGRLQSDARYLAVGWPFAWLMAWHRSALARTVFPALSAALYVLFAYLHITQALAP